MLTEVVLAPHADLAPSVGLANHGRLVLANVLFPRWFQRHEECACTLVSRGRTEASRSDEIQAPGDIEKRKAEARRCRREPGDAAVLKSLSWRRPTRPGPAEVSAPNIS